MKKYHCPSPNAFGDCPYYDENGYCLMVDENLNPLDECDDAMCFDEDGEGWESDEISIEETGVVRRIDELGRIVITKNFRRELGITESTLIEYFYATDAATGRKYLMLAPYIPPRS